ncbi:TetR/AcrR family transcriptional regulator [Streptomyces shenzhenensis]|uniref:TetR family transcriptional regulator n=1 Tax=Streptomyces shenzhenensis TaxID=943815 RepID=A0A3M0I4J7_9ACTN|nr:TetR/AcrR family transcriptional regulator [Streptomyces shenzhenensis]RMB81653.1 TetR family transcriptional regulator [Streptomyces shenzhenensis]
MVRMSTTRPYHHGDLRAALLTGAERTLREKGAGALSLRELAREVGVSHAAPGRHFKDKQALLDALALDGYERLTRILAAADRPALPLEPRMTELGRAYLGFAIDNPELLELMFTRKHRPESFALLAAAVERSLGSLNQLIAEAQERGEIIQGDPDRLNLVAAASLHGTAALVASGALEAEAALAGIAESIHHLLYGLSPR